MIILINTRLEKSKYNLLEVALIINNVFLNFSLNLKHATFRKQRQEAYKYAAVLTPYLFGDDCPALKVIFLNAGLVKLRL